MAGLLLAGAALASSPQRGAAMESMEVLQDPSAPAAKRVEAARAVGKSKDPRGIDALLSALDTTSPELTEACVAALRALGAEAVLGRRLESTEGAPGSRALAARGLRFLRAPKSVGALAKGLSDPDEKVRAASAHALAVFGADKAERQLIEALSDPSKDVRYFVIIALSGLSTGAARSALEGRRAKETDPVLKDELQRVLR